MKLFIRNMACESCKLVVNAALKQVGCTPMQVNLGEVSIAGKMTQAQQQAFAAKIGKAGLQLVQKKEGILLDQIKAAIATYVSDPSINVNLSEYLHQQLEYDYNYLSSYFSAMQANTIEQYHIALKIEKVKELLVVDGLSLTEIAHRLNYSSVAYLSSQFKKVTGLPASHFIQLRAVRRLSMQEI